MASRILMLATISTASTAVLQGTRKIISMKEKIMLAQDQVMILRWFRRGGRAISSNAIRKFGAYEYVRRKTDPSAAPTALTESADDASC